MADERSAGRVVTTEPPTVYIVDDDPDVRESLESLLRSVDLRVISFESAAAFLMATRATGPCCLILDVSLPDQNGLDLQRELGVVGDGIPIIFMTGHGDIPMSVRALKSGATDFLPKPFGEQDLLDAIELSLERDRLRLEAAAAEADLTTRYQSLSPRERQIMAYVVSGQLNKQIAAAVDLSEITVKVHRGHVMRKMGATSVAHLVRMADRLGLESPRES
jgi:FixJ family two-component response regulator